MPDINKDLLLSRIRRSGDFTESEKQYLESLVMNADKAKWFEGDFGDYICSRCGYGYYGPYKPICPGCSAKMEGGEQHD